MFYVIDDLASVSNLWFAGAETAVGAAGIPAGTGPCKTASTKDLRPVGVIAVGQWTKTDLTSDFGHASRVS